MDKKVNQPIKSFTPGVKLKKSSVPGVTLVEFTENVPEGCSAPNIERRPISMTMQEGKSTSFKAVVRGNPMPSVVWSIKEKNLTNDDHYKIYYDTITNEHILQLKQLTPEDAGSYKCTFSNEYGEARCVTNLNIIEVGFKKKLKKPGKIQENVPDPGDFRKMLKKCAGPIKKKNIVDENVWEILMNADKKDYERICMEYGISDFRGVLTKLKQMKIEREEKQAAYVKFLGNLRPIQAKIDGSANFGFDMELKKPNLQIFLYKDENLIPYSMSEDGKHHLKQVGKRYNFCIKDLQPEDIGLYKINVEDAAIFATEVDISHIPVDFKQPLQECQCNETEDAVFECTISVPLPVEWTYKKMTLENNEKYEIMVSPDGLTHRLIVKNVHPVNKGVYTVTAGAGSSTAYLVVGKKLSTTSHHSRSGKDISDTILEQDLDDLKGGIKSTTNRLPSDKDKTTNGLKGRRDLSSEDDRTTFSRGGWQDSIADGLHGDNMGGIGEHGRMGKDGSGTGRGGLVGLGRMDKDSLSKLDGKRNNSMNSVDVIGKDGKDYLVGMGNDGKDGWERMRRDQRGRESGRGGDAKDSWDRMGNDGMDTKGGMDMDGKRSMGEIGKDGKGNQHDGEDYGKCQFGRMGITGMGKDGSGNLYGMGKDGSGNLYGMGKDGKGSLHGMGEGGMGEDGKGRVDEVGKYGLDGSAAIGKYGKDRLDGMGRDGMGNVMSELDGRKANDTSRFGGSGTVGKGKLDGKERERMGSCDGIENGGKDRLNGSGIIDMKGLDLESRLNASEWKETQNDVETGSNQGKNGLAEYGDSVFAGIIGKGHDTDALSMGGELLNMSTSIGTGKGRHASLVGNNKGLLRDDQMPIQDDSMAESKQDLLASDLSQKQTSSARKRKGKRSESEVTIDQKHKSKDGAHNFKSGLSDMSVKKGEVAELCCEMKNEEAQGSWFKDGKKIISGNGKIITKEGAVQKLTLAQVQEEDSGIYTFEADGGRTEGSLFVKAPPEFDQDALDQLGKKPILVKAGHTATVKVPFSGKPPTKVSWYKDGDELFNDNRIRIDNTGNFAQLSISNCNRKDSGRLTVKLKNESGTTSANNIHLSVTDKPQAPQGPIEVLESSDSCITFKWKPPKDDGGKPIQHYLIEKQLVGRNIWTKLGEVNELKTTFSFSKVEPGKNYKFKVWAANSEGVSGALISDTVRVGKRAVPGPVATPKILNANSKSITLSWTPPKKIESSNLIGYIIEKRKKGSNTWTVVTDHPITDMKWTVTNVVEGLEYEFRVTAVNSAGSGEPSCETDSVFARDPIRPPGTVRDLRVTDSTYSTISLAWTPPAYQVNEVAKGYVVEMKSSGNTSWTRCNAFPVGLTSYTIKNLKPMEMLSLRVRSVNDGGMGESLELDNYVLAMPPPVSPKFRLDDSVKSFMIVKEGNSLQVQMPFQASPPPEVIWLKDGLPLSKPATVTITNDRTQLFIPACQRCDSGIYSITLKNPFGQDSFSFEMRATAIPKPPGLVTLNENVPNTVTVSWEPSKDEPLDDHLHYVVKKRDSSRQIWHTVGDNIFNNAFTVINVLPGRKYYFRVLAKNDLGYSESSDSQEPWCIMKQRDPITLKSPNYKDVKIMSTPEFTVKLKTHIAPVGSDICMSCAVKGKPPPHVTWFKNNINIMNNANFWSTNVYGVCSLCIFCASPKDTGEYMAIAENSVGRAVCSTRLTIRE
ncbi:immunoglobulin-like and fibronectin type III domain-containing protein 1 [Narcine bancroftii]|uniref:immunoglobulin-like and fibronectin type III domain-containing protein 1 n=1 Tax=Narcine bancroftii TaxID=1343680 RepID=UPI0038316B14